MPDNKIVLAFSGGLDTSVAVPWLKEKYGADVITLTIDLGMVDLEFIKERAMQVGAVKALTVDGREPLVQEFLYPALQAGAIYEEQYPLATALGRPLIARYMVEAARAEGAFAVAHGCTGKGNDQVRFELGAYALKPDVKIIAPWREWDLSSRSSLMDYAEKHNIPIDYQKQSKKSPYSMDANLLHISYEGDILEDPWVEAEDDMWRWTVSPEDAPDQAEYIEITYEKGDIVAINGETMSPATVMEDLNRRGSANGIGRLDLVENRFVGMKSRGCYETPAGTIMIKAHRAIESITLDREAAHLKDELMPKYAKLIYNGFWWSPERDMLQAAIDKTQASATGTVRLKLYKGNVIVEGRQAPNSLYNKDIATFEADQVYNQADAEGFIRINALRLRALKEQRG